MLSHFDHADLRMQLVELRKQHRELDETIHQLIENSDTDQIALTRMKRQKLHLKDQITHINSQLIPDLNA